VHWPQTLTWLANLPASRLLLLLLLHGLAAAGDGAGATLGNNELSAAIGAAVLLTYLIRHGITTFLSRCHLKL
jgi:NhaP-type Na+/H+ and K+/H+ antiporter